MQASQELPDTLVDHDDHARDVPASLASLRVAIVHYWFVGRAGGEHVVEALANIFPQAHLFALIARPESMSADLQRHPLQTSFLQKIPLVHRFHRHTLALQPLALEQFDLSSYDLVLSSESGPAKGVLTSPRTLHLCYCHSPMRYIWDMYPSYAQSMPLLTRFIFALTAHGMRLWDAASATRVDMFVANSRFVAKRIHKLYRRQSLVVHPPVQVRKAWISDQHDDYYLALGRLVDYKRFDLAITACNQLGRNLTIIGDGPCYKQLKRIAGKTIQFVGGVSDVEKAKYLARCRALLFPGEEDFGIVPVEAQAFGRPVIGFGSGGLLETVRGWSHAEKTSSTATGVFFSEQTPESLKNAILRFEANEHCFRPAEIRQHALQFDSTVFRSRMIQVVLDALSTNSLKDVDLAPLAVS